MKRNSIFFLLLLILVVGSGYYFFSGGDTPSQAGGAPAMMGGAPQAVPMMLETVKEESYRVWNEFSGRLEAVDSVEVRPRVSGAITKILFKEGANVKAGEELITIDPRPFEAALAEARAMLASARSESSLAKTELDRAQALVKKGFLSKSAFDQRKSTYNVARAAIQSAEAAVKTAKLNVEYAHVKAPISGRVGRAELTVGNVVSSGAGAPILTTIVASEQMYAEFEVDEQTYLSMVRYKQDKGTDMPVQLKLKSDDEPRYKGVIHSFDNQLDAGSGTIRARAIFENKDGALIPGMFASVRLGSAAEEKVIRVSERAVGVDQSRRFVYVVGNDNKTAYREVELGALEDGKRVVLSGLAAGERIVPSGLQKVRPGMDIAPIETQPTSANTKETPPVAAEAQ